MSLWKTILFVALAALAGVASHAAPAADRGESPLWSFVPGRYRVIGCYPDGSRTYAGTAQIDRSGKQLRLLRRIDGRESRIFGVIRRADPGEALVLSFKWNDQGPMEMLCLIGSDLDNYPRLTCHWGKAGNPHKQPGMEAYFAQEPWEPLKD